jgi:carbon monoxide dehydrogenase subunit G
MKFHLDGKFAIQAPPEKVFSSLSNPEFMVSCIPDLQSHSIIDENHFNAKVKVGIGLVRGSVEMKFSMAEKDPPKRARLVGDGSGAGSRMHIESLFDLSPENNGTLMTWSADADLSGLMAGIGGPVLKNQSEKQVNQIFANIKSKLEG